MATNVNNLKPLPLFIGLSDNELQEIANNTPVMMKHHKKGSAICEADREYDELTFIMKGWYERETESDNHAYRITENMQAPQVLEPDKLFGLQRRFRSTYRSLTPCDTISISKERIMELIGNNLIVRLNYLNMVCRTAQQREKMAWTACPEDLKHRIARFIRERVSYPAGYKRVYIKMTQLAEEVNASRIEVSNALNSMADEERIILKRGIIEIPALQLL